MRNVILAATIVSLTVLGGCMSAQKKTERAAALARIESEARARLKHAQEESQRRHQDAGFLQWQKKNEPYLRNLCATAPGPEHAHASETYRVVVSTDTERASEAAATGRRIIKCQEFHESQHGGGRDGH